MKPLISIVVPVYNSEKYLAQCLSSLRDQTYTNIEVLLIDDGSSDNSASICRSFAKEDKRFHYYYQENSGVSAARNKGIDLANGEYIGFCDSDDWIEKDMYEFLINLAMTNRSDVTICSFYRDTVTEIDLTGCDHVQKDYSPEEAIIEMHRGRYFAGHLWNKIYRRSVIGQLRLDDDITVMEDMLFVWKVFQNSQKITYQNTKKYHYIQYPLSASHYYRESYWSAQTATQRMLMLMQEYYPDNLLEAKRTVVFGNTVLARKISEAKKMNKANYKRIQKMIDENYSKDATAWFSKSDKRMLTIFRINRLLFNFYVYCALKKEKVKRA